MNRIIESSLAVWFIGYWDKEFDYDKFHEMMDELSIENDITDIKILMEIYFLCATEISFSFGHSSITSQSDFCTLTKIFVEEYGVDIHFDNDKLLDYACNKGNFIVAKYLLEQGANPNNSKTILEPVISYGNLDMIKLLIEYGFNLRDLEKIAYEHLLYLSIVSNSNEILDFFLDLGFKITSIVFFSAVERNRISMVKLLIKYGYQISNIDNDAVSLAIQNRYPEILELLLESGASVDYLNVDHDNSGNDMKICNILRNHNVDDDMIIKLLTMKNIK